MTLKRMQRYNINECGVCDTHDGPTGERTRESVSRVRSEYSSCTTIRM